MLLMLFHGKASVERGFSINKDILDPNLQETSLVAQCLVFDTVKSTGIRVENFPIAQKLVKLCASAHMRYTVYLEEKKKEEAKVGIQKRRKQLQETLVEAKKKKQKLEARVELLTKEVNPGRDGPFGEVKCIPQKG